MTRRQGLCAQGLGGILLVTALCVHAAACGGDEASLDATVALVRTVRGEVQVGERVVETLARVSAGAGVSVAARGRARLVLDSGPFLLLGEGARVQVVDQGAAQLEAGQVYVEVEPGDRLELASSQGTLRVADAAASIEASEAALSVYVLRGEVGWTRGDAHGLARAGERLTLDGGEPRVEAAVLWEDWTGGLARPGPGDDEALRGVGSLEARVPEEVGKARWPLVVRRLDVRVRIVDDLAITEVDQIFFNPASETVEGLYRVRVPTEAVLQRFAVDRNGTLVDGYVREKAQARQAYEAQVYRGSTLDPALLEWDAPGAYRARIYPIAAGETRRVLVRYAEWLGRPAPGEPRVYRFPMGGGERAPQLQELAIVADVSAAGAEGVRAGMGAEVDGGDVVLRRSDFRPRADFWLELVDAEPAELLRAYRADHSPPQRAPDSRAIPNEADERDYWYLPVVLPAAILPEGQAPSGLDLVVVADVSAATDRAHLELGRTVVESLVAQLGADDRVAVVTGDLTIRGVGAEGAPALVAATPERVEALLEGLARAPAGGATDLGAAIAAAATLLDPARPGAVVYVGDGAPTVGELGAEGLLEHLGRLPSPARLYAVGVGSDANLELLEALTRGGGLALRVTERASAADAALDVLAHAARPLAQRVTVELGTGLDNVFPRRPVDVVVGEVLPVVGRVRGDLPSSVTVKGTILGREFEHELRIRTDESADAADLRLRWAGERLRQLLLEGATREEVAELGTRYGLITPFTSYYVPSADELSRMPGASVLVDRPTLAERPRRATTARAPRARAGAVVLPAMVGACLFSGGGDEEAASQGPAPATSVPQPALEAPRDEPASEEAEATDDSQGGSGGRRQDNVDGRMAGREGSMGSPVAAAPEPTPDVPSGGDFWDGDDHGGRDPAAPPARMAAPGSGATGAFDTTTAVEADRLERSREANEQAAAGPQGQAANRYGVAGPDDAQPAEVGILGALGDGEGFGGLGLRGGGGGGGGTIDLGNIGHGGGGGSGSGYGRGAGAGEHRVTIGSGRADVRGSLSREVIQRVVRRHQNEVRFCYEQGLAANPGMAGTVTVGFVVSPTGAVQSSTVGQTTLGHAATESCITMAVRRWTFPAPEGSGVVAVRYPFVLATSGGRPAPGGGPRGGPGGGPAFQITHVTTVVSAYHRPSRCSDAADLLPDDKRALWRERLGAASSVSEWVDVYRQAVRSCEARTWRERRTLLGLILDRAGTIARMVDVYHYLDDGSGRGFLRAAILRRVRTPDDLRLVRESFGLSRAVDWELVEQVLDRAPTPAARIRALRALVAQLPHSFDLALRLLEELERAGRPGEAGRLAHTLRTDPLADAGVRTAIGEMYLRAGDEAEARRVFSEIVEFAPMDELARRRLGDLYRAHGWFEDAYRQYLTLSQIRPDDTMIYLLLAQAAAGAGRVDEALRLEQRLAETAEPGGAQGVARTAILWSSVRFAKLRKEARAAEDAERVRALLARMRRSGVLREAGALRASLTWSHPDAGLSLWASHPGLGLSRPTDISPELGIEAFDVREAEDGRYRLEVRRVPPADGRAHVTPVTAELVVVWDEGKDDEKIEVTPLRFEGERLAFAFELEGRTLTEARPSTEGGAR